MNRLVSLLLAALCLSFTAAFAPAHHRVSAPSATALNVFGNKKSAAAKTEEESKYWQGEWVCKDCGYIYNRVSAEETRRSDVACCALHCTMTYPVPRNDENDS